MSALRDFQSHIADLQAKERENAKARAAAVVEKEKDKKTVKAKERAVVQENGTNGTAEIHEEETAADNTGVDFRLQASCFFDFRHKYTDRNCRSYYNPLNKRMQTPPGT